MAKIPYNQRKNENQEPKKGINFNWVYLLLASFLLIQIISYSFSGAKEITWQEFEREMLLKRKVDRLEVINKEQVEVYILQEELGKGYFEEVSVDSRGPHYIFQIGSVETFEQNMQRISTDQNLDVSIKYGSRVNVFKDVLMWILPFALIIGLWIFIMRRSMGGPSGGMGGGSPFDFGKSKATIFDPSKQPGVTFKDVAGHEEAKIEVMEIVDFLKHPEYYTRLGAKIPKGVILAGPPGTGKTLMARAVAGEAQVPFFSISGSEFVEMFVGVGASRVRDLFKNAKSKAPSIIFIDEIDAIGRARGGALSMRSNDERESTLNQLLTEMDGFEANSGVIVMAATNRQDILDNALLRPGRFDRHIYLELPNFNERKSIFEVHLKRIIKGADLDLDLLAIQTPGFSGADIANICNEAALIAARKKKEAVFMQDFHDATDRVIAGLENKSKIISPEEKYRIAIHESGHATVSWFLPYADTLMKVSIVPRGKALGAAWYQPKEHQLYIKDQFLDRMSAMLGGRAAEELIFKSVSSGALDDLEKVTKLAYTMVAYYGLNEKLGNISYYDSSGQYEQSFQKPYSEATAQLIDQEVQNMVKEAYTRCLQLLEIHRVKLEALAALLQTKEIVLKDDLVALFGERPDQPE
jgi:AFG3 family protein